METTNNSILITGGSTGIGLAIAESFIKAGNEVLICGRRESKLFEAKQKLPQLHIRVCDLRIKQNGKNYTIGRQLNFPISTCFSIMQAFRKK